MSFEQIAVDRGSQYVQWQDAGGLSEAQKARVARGDLGEVQEVAVLEDGSCRVKTDLGTLTLSGPALDAVKEDLSVGDFLTAESHISSIDPNVVIDMVNILKLLAQTNIQRRQVDREVRLANRDMAMAEATNAADEIRKGAMFNLIFGCVSGAINIGMGAMSAVGSFKALTQLKTPMQEVKLAQTEVKALKSQETVFKSQVELADAQAQLKVDQAKLQDANKKVTLNEQKVQELQSKYDQQVLDKTQTVADCKKTHTELQTAKKELADARIEQQKAADVVKTSETVVQEKTQAVKDAQSKALVEQENLVDQAKAGEKRANDRVDKLKQDLAKAKPDSKEYQRLSTELKAAEVDKATKIEIREQAESDLAALKSFKVTDTRQNALKNLNSVQERLGDPRITDPATAYGRMGKASEVYNATVTEIQTKATLYQGLGQAGSGAAQIFNSVGQTIEATSQAASKEHDAQAERAKTAADDITQDMQTAADILRDVKECLESMRQSQNQVFQAIMQA